MPTVSAFPAELGGDISLAAGDAVGWVLDASFTMAVDVSVWTGDDPAVTVAVTERELTTGGRPENAVWREQATESARGDAIEITDGTGSVVVAAAEETTARVSVDATLI